MEDRADQRRGGAWCMLSHLDQIVAPKLENGGVFVGHDGRRPGRWVDAEHLAENTAFAKPGDLARRIVRTWNHGGERALDDYNHGVSVRSTRAQGFARCIPSFVHVVDEIGSVALGERIEESRVS
jgi:hypothetical protein